MKKILTSCLALLLLAAACTGDSGITGPNERDDRVVDVPDGGFTLAASLTPFEACSDFLEHVQANALEAVGPWGLDGGGVIALQGGIAVDAVEEAQGGFDADDSAAARDGGGEAGVDYSTTNVQEIGVDEPDIVKTDGERIVALAQGRVHVVDVTGREPVLMGSVSVDGVWVNEMFLVGDRVLLLAHSDSGALPVDSVARIAPGFYSPASVLVEVDISDAARPQVLHRLHLDGWYLSARLVGDVARIVVQSSPTGLAWNYPEGGGLRSERASLEANQELIRNSTVENWLPYFILEDGRGRVVDEGTLVDCERAYHPTDFSGLQMLNVVTLDLSGDGLAGVLDATSVLADGQTVYASTDSLYVGTTEWVDRRLVEQSWEDDSVELPPVVTNVHKFDIADPARTDYVASGAVVGTVLNQYSMSEHEGRLRIATTDFDQWGRGDGSVSQVSVLEQNEGELVVVGDVGDLGRGERIFAVRFMGDMAAVVTFRQTDPLYTIDLSDPTNPVVLGELKIL
ncbi:MAG: beta-propeller domain-containing protein, partial [Actinomycetota bacterium]|nr:beta-propeller domain-containing protein [Actinomycetota bacterium]